MTHQNEASYPWCERPGCTRRQKMITADGKRLCREDFNAAVGLPNRRPLVS